MTIETRFTSHLIRFCERYNISRTAFGKKALGDSDFLFALSEGRRSPTLSTVAKVFAFMREYRRQVKEKQQQEATHD